MDILTRIYQLRQERGWSEYRLAVNAEIAQSTISTWYKKDQLPNILSLERICKGFGITMAEFFLEKEEGEWIKLTEEEERLFEIWKTFSPLQRSRTLEWMPLDEDIKEEGTTNLSFLLLLKTFQFGCLENRTQNSRGTRPA